MAEIVRAWNNRMKQMNHALRHYIKKIFGCMLLPVVVLNQIAAAGELGIQFTDATGKPLANAVAALIATAAVNYNNQPSATMDQRDNLFVPGVLAVRVNTLVHFPNSDDVRHHVYSFSPVKKFELRLYHGMTAEPVLFDQPGKVILGCNIHDSMIGYIYVVNSEYFAVSDAEGKLLINNIPSGDYQLEIYHPKLNRDYPTEQLRLGDQKIISKNIQLDNLSEPAFYKPADEFSELFQ